MLQGLDDAGGGRRVEAGLAPVASAGRGRDDQGLDYQGLLEQADAVQSVRLLRWLLGARVVVRQCCNFDGLRTLVPGGTKVWKDKF